MSPKVTFQPFGRRVSVAPGTTLLAAAAEAGIAIVSFCGGAGICDSCRVRVVRGAVSAVSGHETEQLLADDLALGYRLACQVAVTAGEVVVDVPVESVGTAARLQLEWKSEFMTPDAGRWSSESGLRTSGSLGLAVDVGTTKVAAYLVELGSGRTLAAAGAVNPQVVHGEDVVSRIAYADRTPGGREALHALVIRCIDDLASALCGEQHAERSEIVEVVIVGNTVMHHLAADLSVSQLGRAPFLPAVTGPLSLQARKIGLSLDERAMLYMPPNVAGYVGADHVAALTALGALERANNTLIIDIGTNTEVSLISEGRILSCSCASGPAFEGAHIGCGMRAAAGAIERVRVIDGRVRWQSIGSAAPIGICGSGVLDAVAELVENGAVDRHGGLRSGHTLLSDSAAGPVFRLASPSATGHNRELALNRGDISQIQLAKAAIRTGIRMLVRAAGMEEHDLAEVVVAGAFGTYIDLASARRVGLLPDLPASRFCQAGNAAGAGARQMLVSPASRSIAERIAARAEHIDLTANAQFGQVFASELLFNVGSDRGRNHIGP